MTDAVHFSSLFKESVGTRHVQLRFDDQVIFDSNMIDVGETQILDITEPVEGEAKVRLGIVTEDGSFHPCRYLDEVCSQGGGPANPCPFELDLRGPSVNWPDSPAEFDTETTTGLPPFGGGTFQLEYEGRLL